MENETTIIAVIKDVKLHDLLMNEENCIPIDEAISNSKKKS